MSKTLLRGQVQIEIFGKKYDLDSSIENIMQIEDLGYSVPALFRRAMAMQNKKDDAQLSFKDIASVIYASLLTVGETNYSFKEVAKEMRRVGFLVYLHPVMSLLSSMVTEEEAESDEKKSEDTEPPSKPTKKKSKKA